MKRNVLRLWLSLLGVVLLGLGVAHFVEADPTTEKLNARIFMSYGSTVGRERILLDYTESTSTTGFQAVVIPVELAASATDTSLNLASYVDTATMIAVRDRNNTGVKVGLASGGTKAQVAANGFYCYKNGNATPPTLYFDNVSGSTKAFIEVIIMGSSS